MKPTFFVLLLASTVLASCGGKGTQTIEETTTRGNIRIASDEAFKQVVDAELFVFHNEYKYAKVNPTYLSEGEALNLLKRDSVRMIILSRKLTELERNFFKDKKLNPKETLIAYDGLTFICNKSNKDTAISYNQLKQLFAGKIGKWSDLDPNGSEDSIRIVFDSPTSGNARYVKELFALSELPANCFATRTNEEALKYVEDNPSAIAVVSSGLISDMDDTTSQNFLDNIHVIGVSAQNDPDGKNGYRQPFQEYIADGSYPFKREIYSINCEVGTRLGTGFASFVASDKGQRIILKSGLLPAVVPVRFVEVSQDF